jgi:peptide chain release factor
MNYCQELSLDTIWLSLSAGTGPEECARAAALTLEVLCRELEEHPGGNLTFRIIETGPSRIKGNIRSALLALEGSGAAAFAEMWTGVILWIWWSAYRPHHKRKNWFVSITQYREPEPGTAFSPSDVRFETTHAGGPGGQYVNKTESAVRAVHVPSGKSVTAREERSQMLNKRLALARLALLLNAEQVEKQKQAETRRRHTHYELERGNPIRIYDGDTKKLMSLRAASHAVS